MGVRISDSKTISVTGESDLFAIPSDYIAYLRRLSVSNVATAPTTIQIIYYNGTSKKTVMTFRVAVGETVVFEEDELPLEGCPTKISVSTDQQPVIVDYSVELS
jgi:hypothetical protein